MWIPIPAAAFLALGMLTTASPAQPSEAPPMLSVQFPGGTVAEYVDALRTAAKPAPANIALSEEAAAAVLPAIRLEQVTVGTALSALEFVAPSDTGEHWVIAPLSSRRAGEPDAYAVALARRIKTGGEYVDAIGGTPAKKQSRMVQVFSLSELIGSPATGGGLTADTILSAVELALSMREPAEGKPADLKFHADSGLLIMNASGDEVRAVDELFRRLKDDAMRERAMSESLGRQRIDDELNLDVAKAKMQSCETHVAFTAETLSSAKQLVESGQAPIEAARGAEMEHLSARTDLDIVTAEFKAAMARMEQSRARKQSAAPQAEVSQLRDQVAILQARIKELEAKKK